MLIEKIELTMSHLGLGALNEFALMVLFGDAHSHHLTMGKGIRPDQILNDQGNALYPAYFMTSLKVPSSCLLNSYRLWEKVEIGVDIKRFGDTLLESSYLLGREGKVPSEREEWELPLFPSMKANNLIVVDEHEGSGGTRSVSNPRSDCIAALTKLTKIPQAIIQSKKIRTKGFFQEGMGENLKNKEPILYHVINGRDVASERAMIFAKFCEIMDYAEFTYLSQEFRPSFPLSVLHDLAVLEREIYYYGNCYAGESLEIYLKGGLQDCSSDYHGESGNIISAATLDLQFEIYQRRNNSLLAIAKVKKLFAIPIENQDLVQDVHRLVSEHQNQ